MACCGLTSDGAAPLDGFRLATFALIALLGMILGGAPWKATLLAAIMAPSLWALFDQVLGLPLDFLGLLFG